MSNIKINEICNGIILSAAQEIIANDQLSPLSDEKMGAFLELQKKCYAFADEGFTSRLIVPICQKKTNYIKDATTKTELKEILEIPKIRYNGNEVVPYGKYHVPEEEALIWSITSLKAPLNQAGLNRYLKLFKEIFPDMADVVDPRNIYESKPIEITDTE